VPIYEYECGKCKGVFEEYQFITAPPLDKCRLCGSRKVHKILSQTSFILKGSGWYVTDYGKSGGGGKADKKPSEPSSSTGDGGSDAKADKGDKKDAGAKAAPKATSAEATHHT